MRLSRANIPLASEDRTHSQAISPSPHYNLAPHFWPGFINLQHFCHSRWRNPVRLSKSGLATKVVFKRSSATFGVSNRMLKCSASPPVRKPPQPPTMSKLFPSPSNFLSLGGRESDRP